MPSTDNQSELEKIIGHLLTGNYAWVESELGGTNYYNDEIERINKTGDEAKVMFEQLIKAHDTKLYEQVMGAIGEDKSVKQLLPNVEFKPDEYCAGIVAAKDASNRNLKELRTAINKIFNKENTNG